MLLPSGQDLTSAEYVLSWAFSLVSNRHVTDTGDPSRTQTNPVFGADNQSFSITLVFKDITNVTLERVDVTSLSSLDLLPYLTGGGVVATAFDTTGDRKSTRLNSSHLVI